MSKKLILSRTTLRAAFLLAGLSVQIFGYAAIGESFDRLRINEVVQSVEVRDSDGGKRHAAKVNEIFDRQRVLTTGGASRAELLAEDGTVTRVGSNTVFSFIEGKREVNLEKGTLLFHSPTGKGGGVIRSPGATAGVIGTSVVVSATKDGGFKLLVLEGKAKATLPGGKAVSIGAGQLTFVLPGKGGSGGFGPVVNFRLRDQVAGAKLVTGFKAPLASLPKITEAVEAQEKKLAEGKAEATSMQVTGSSMIDVSQIMSLRAETLGTTALKRALDSDYTLNDNPIPSERVFDYPSANIPNELLDIMGPSASTVFSKAADGTFRFFVARNLSVLGGPGDDTGIGVEHPFIVAARDALLFDDGRSADDPDLLNPLHEVDYGPFIDPPLWFAAGKSITVRNSTIDVNSPWMLFGADGAAFGGTDGGYPVASVEISNSALVNGGGMIGLAGSTVKVSDASVVAHTSITVTGGQIEIANISERSFLAGFQGNDDYPDVSSASSGSAQGKISARSSGDLTVKNARLAADHVELTAGKTLKVDGARVAARSTISMVANAIDINSNTAKDFLAGYGNGYASSSGRISMVATDTLSVKNANLGAASVSLDARTIALEDVNFRPGSSVVLSSGLGQLAANPNTNQPVVPRMVNFVRNVTYAGEAAQNQIQSGGNPGGKITLRANGR